MNVFSLISCIALILSVIFFLLTKIVKLRIKYRDKLNKSLLSSVLHKMVISKPGESDPPDKK